MLDKKNWRKKFQIFFIFHKKISQKIFLKNHKGPPYEKRKKFEFFFFNFFYPTCSLGHPKMSVRSFFEKSLTNFECALSVHSKKPPAPFCNFLILLSAHSVSRLCVWTSKKWVVQIFFSFQSCNSLQMSSMQDLTHDVMKKMTLMLSLAHCSCTITHA